MRNLIDSNLTTSASPFLCFHFCDSPVETWSKKHPFFLWRENEQHQALREISPKKHTNPLQTRCSFYQPLSMGHLMGESKTRDSKTDFLKPGGA